MESRVMPPRIEPRSGGVTQCVLELEEHVHRADFLDILVLLAIEPKHLLIALLLRDIARKNRSRVVAARFRETDAALHRANQFRLHINTDWRKTLGLIRAGRRTNMKKRYVWDA